jgi:hypothetical protein
MRQKPLLALTLIILTLSLAGIGIRHMVNEKRAQEKREVAYQSVLRTYTQLFKPGVPRKEVEDYLRAKNTKFRQMCCVNAKDSSSRRTWDDLAKIAEEDVPWVCRENNVYVAFEFTDYEKQEARWGGNDLDTLKALTIYHQLEGCV